MLQVHHALMSVYPAGTITTPPCGDVRSPSTLVDPIYGIPKFGKHSFLGYRPSKVYGKKALAFWPHFGLRDGQARPKPMPGQKFGLALAFVPKPKAMAFWPEAKARTSLPMTPKTEFRFSWIGLANHDTKKNRVFSVGSVRIYGVLLARFSYLYAGSTTPTFFNQSQNNSASDFSNVSSVVSEGRDSNTSSIPDW
jgi:hypothetical protein